jgi:hypothetical protein
MLNSSIPATYSNSKRVIVALFVVPRYTFPSFYFS